LPLVKKNQNEEVTENLIPKNMSKTVVVFKGHNKLLEFSYQSGRVFLLIEMEKSNKFVLEI
jgi:hypothetical protein